eukprot:CAMPEP_0116006462 /NCGR_PEP_ID=MMETSP0321-20121206/1742_1 /TAXON_ID=163516 /ORGANISM="Leptocylindrus danicus var. danicus, Strain B650" /LENGTH=401 /DNA_ID=CAMNT_0003475019 /DNA_START=632 /DNA_END=1834 /DNA_ORIENTATION=+
MASYANDNVQLAIPVVETIVTAVPVPTITHGQRPNREEFEPFNLQQLILDHSDRIEPLDAEIIEDLKSQGYTDGLIRALKKNRVEFPIRFWVVDNSGSMWTDDGHRVIHQRQKSGDVHQVSIDCTRWDEIKESVIYHANMAARLNMPTIFRLLNDPGSRLGSKTFGICCGGSTSKKAALKEFAKARLFVDQIRPHGVTPLTDHILAIQEQLVDIAPQLNATGKRAVIVIATDGIPTDSQGYDNQCTRSQFVQALRLLEGLPVWIVIRICTDEDDVVEFYNDLDEKLELSLEVLDDFYGEAQEVFEFNPWLNYSLPIHRIRELGFHDRVFDLIDERKLTKNEVREYCTLLLGPSQSFGSLDPVLDWNSFVVALEHTLRKELKHWNPVYRKEKKLVSIKRLKW